MTEEIAILLVDDEKTILNSLKGQLRRLFGRRFSYETAENVSEAWEVIEELQDDGVRIVLVVSDWLMPETRGDEFLIEIAERFPGIVRVMLTGQADHAAILKVRQSGVQHVIQKPWSEADLRAIIETSLMPGADS